MPRWSDDLPTRRSMYMSILLNEVSLPCYRSCFISVAVLLTINALDCPIHNDFGLRSRSPSPEPPGPRRSCHITFITDPDPETYCEGRMDLAGDSLRKSRSECLCIIPDNYVDEKSQTSDSDLSQAGCCGSLPTCRPPKEPLSIDHITDKASDWRGSRLGEGSYSLDTNTAKVAYTRGYQ